MAIIKLWLLHLMFFSVIAGTIAETWKEDDKSTQIELAPPPGTFCPGHECGEDPDIGVPICCPKGTFCSINFPYLCCPIGHVGVDGICCPKGRYKRCGNTCCALNCSNGVCCPNGQFGVNGICCPSPTDNNCGGKCCSGSCFSGTCCPYGQYLSNGVCCPATEVCCPAGLVPLEGRCCLPGSILCAGNCCKGFCHVQFVPLFPPGSLPSIYCLHLILNLTESSLEGD